MSEQFKNKTQHFIKKFKHNWNLKYILMTISDIWKKRNIDWYKMESN